MRFLMIPLLTVLLKDPIAFCAPPAAEEPFARVSEATGEVYLRGADGKRAPLKAGAVVGNGAQLETGAQGAAQLRLADESEVRAGPDTRMKLEANSGKAEQVDITLESGKLRGEVRKRIDGRRHFFVKTPSATLGVRGTSFVVSVAREGADVVKSEFYCMSGQVHVTDHSGKTLGDLKGGLALSVGARGGPGGMKLLDSRPQVKPIPPAMMGALGNDQFLRSRESGDKFESRMGNRGGRNPNPDQGQGQGAKQGKGQGEGPGAGMNGGGRESMNKEGAGSRPGAGGGPGQGQGPGMGGAPGQSQGPGMSGAPGQNQGPGMSGGPGQSAGGAPGAGGAMDASRPQNAGGARPGPGAPGGGGNVMRPMPGPTGISPAQPMPAGN